MHPKEGLGLLLQAKQEVFRYRISGYFGTVRFFTVKIGKSETGRFGVLGRGRLKHYENRGLRARGARSLLEVLAVSILGSSLMPSESPSEASSEAPKGPQKLPEAFE